MSQRPRVFICYRREDLRWQANLLAEAIAGRFGHDAVFMDRDIRPGNWHHQIDRALADSVAVIVIIGPRWLSDFDTRQAADDQVRYEISESLRLGKTIIPVTVDRAQIPARASLPAEIAPLTDAQGYELGVDVMWGPTVGKLLDDLSTLLENPPASPPETDSRYGTTEQATPEGGLYPGVDEAAPSAVETSVDAAANAIAATTMEQQNGDIPDSAALVSPTFGSEPTTANSSSDVGTTTAEAAVVANPKRYWPLERGRIVTCEYGPRPGGFHYGIDFGWPGGSANKAVYAIQSGVVIYSGQAQGYGGPDPAGWLVIDSTDDEGGGCLEYGHIIREVNNGDRVTAGQRIARINPSQQTNGGVPPHLHVSAWPYHYGQGGQSGKVNPRTRWLHNPSEPGPSLNFPLPAGYFYGPSDGPDNSVSGEYPGEPAAWRDGLGRWQSTLGLPVTKKWNDGKTPNAATTVQRSLGLPPTPGIGYGCIGQAEWDAVLTDGWRLPKGWKAKKAAVSE